MADQETPQVENVREDALTELAVFRAQLDEDFPLLGANLHRLIEELEMEGTKRQFWIQWVAKIIVYQDMIHQLLDSLEEIWTQAVEAEQAEQDS